MGKTDQTDEAAEIARWLIGEARLSLAPLELIERFCRRLVALGVPLWRLRAGQRLANPLASAWGVIWTRDGTDTREYVVPRATLSTGAYYGSPFQHVVEAGGPSGGGCWTWTPSAIIRCCTRWPRRAAPTTSRCRSSTATARCRR